MKNIDKQIGALLFDRILETTENKSLKPKEKIPKYRSILDDLFKALTVLTYALGHPKLVLGLIIQQIKKLLVI